MRDVVIVTIEDSHPNAIPSNPADLKEFETLLGQVFGPRAKVTVKRERVE